MNAAFISKVETVGTGGNCMADLIELKNGRVVYVTDECIGVCENMKQWHDGPVEDYRDMDYASVGSCQRGRSMVGLTFVRRIGTFEPEGPVSVDMVYLHDGRILGIDSDSAVLYPSLQAFDAITETGEAGDFPAIDL